MELVALEDLFLVELPSSSRPSFLTSYVLFQLERALSLEWRSADLNVCAHFRRRIASPARTSSKGAITNCNNLFLNRFPVLESV